MRGTTTLPLRVPRCRRRRPARNAKTGRHLVGLGSDMDPTGGPYHQTAVPLRWRIYSALEPPGSTRNQDRDGSSPRIAYLVEALLVGVIPINSASLILWTMPSLKADYVFWFHVIEFCTIAVFLAEYFLRFWTAPEANPEVADWGQRWRYVGSPSALIDAPALFPSAAAVVASLVTGDGLSPVVPAGGSADYPLCEAGAVFSGWPSIGHGHAVEGKPAADHGGGLDLRAGDRRLADVLCRVKRAAGRVQQHSGGDVVERRNADDSGLWRHGADDDNGPAAGRGYRGIGHRIIRPAGGATERRAVGGGCE